MYLRTGQPPGLIYLPLPLNEKFLNVTALVGSAMSFINLAEDLSEPSFVYSYLWS